MLKIVTFFFFYKIFFDKLIEPAIISKEWWRPANVFFEKARRAYETSGTSNNQSITWHSLNDCDYIRRVEVFAHTRFSQILVSRVGCFSPELKF
jgi:hypothetical protein